jgi:hypothetical protein
MFDPSFFTMQQNPMMMMKPEVYVDWQHQQFFQQP